RTWRKESHPRTEPMRALGSRSGKRSDLRITSSNCSRVMTDSPGEPHVPGDQAMVARRFAAKCFWPHRSLIVGATPPPNKKQERDHNNALTVDTCRGPWLPTGHYQSVCRASTLAPTASRTPFPSELAAFDWLSTSPCKHRRNAWPLADKG